MAEEYKTEGGDHQEVEVKERGLFDHFTKKDEEKSHEEILVTGVEKVHIEDDEEKKESLLHKLHRSSSSSSSSSSSDEEEEVEVDGVVVKQKKKKGLKEKIKEKLGGHQNDEEEVKQEVVQEVAAATVITDSYGDTEVKVEKVDEKLKVEGSQEEEKGFLVKIKEKLPGNKKTVEEAVAAPPPAVSSEGDHGHDGKEKKGILGKIMEKLPGYRKEDKESEKTR